MGLPLSASNPYLRNSKARARSVLRSVATSSAIEGIRAPFKAPQVTVKAGRKSAKKLKA